MSVQSLYREVTTSYRTQPHELFVALHPDREAEVAEGPRRHFKWPLGPRTYVVDTREKGIIVQTFALTSDGHLLDDILCALRYAVGSPEAMIRDMPEGHEDELSRLLQSHVRLEVRKKTSGAIAEAKPQLETMLGGYMNGYLGRWGLKLNGLDLERLERSGDYTLGELRHRHVLAIAEEQCRADLAYLKLVNEARALESSGMRKAVAEAEIRKIMAAAEAEAERIVAESRLRMLTELARAMGEKVTPENIGSVIRALDGFARGDQAFASRFQCPTGFGGIVAGYRGWWQRIGHWESLEELDRKLMEENFPG